MPLVIAMEIALVINLERLMSKVCMCHVLPPSLMHRVLDLYMLIAHGVLAGDLYKFRF